MFCSCKRGRRARAKELSLDPIPSNFPREIPTEDDAPLCSVCSTLDLRTILQYGIPKKHAALLGQLADILNKYDQCGLCRLVATGMRRKWQTDELPDVDLAGITCTLQTTQSPLAILNGPLPEPRYERLHISTPGRPHDLKAVHFGSWSEFDLLEEDASKVGKMKEFHGRRVGQTVDTGLLKRWIHICENGHRDRCEKLWWGNPGDVLPKSIRVLDVARMAIIPAPPSCRYVALSYVWGGTGEQYWTTQANLKQRSRRGGLDASLMPETISDTIQLICQLGERYLWIDALCIVQDDPEDKVVQIRMMDLIYGGSAFTVYAVGSTCVRDPLPGVRPGTRDPQQQVTKIQGLHLAIPHFLNEAIASSTWNQRGWTYQELMLSRRRVFFTAHQVHFECEVDMWCEGIVAEPVGYPRGAIHSDGSDHHVFAGQWSNSGAYMKDYKYTVKNITQRRFTVESDILDASMALFTALTKGHKVAGGDIDKAFRFGMPLVDLDEALLWQPAANASHSRRLPANGIMAPWPSWSWAGWQGAAGYSNTSVFVKIYASTEPNDSIMIDESPVEQWYIINDDGQPVRLDVRRYRRAKEHYQRAKSSTYVTPKGDIDTEQLMTENVPLQSGTLVFRTSSARFDVTKAHDVADADVSTNYAIYSILSDIPRPSTLVGRVILPCSTHSPTSCEFIVLSRTTYSKGLYDQDVLGIYYSGCMLYVMAVQKVEDETRMERVGVGVIFELAWPTSTAERKIVFLR
jgi:hypothetical protein